MDALAVTDLRKVYETGLEALSGINLNVSEGDFFALLGPNGAGKTTLIGIITSLVCKTSGQVRIFDLDIDHNFDRAKTLIGVVPQEFNANFFETCEQVLIHQAGYYGVPRTEAKARVAELLEALGLAEKRKTISRALSGGMKRRLMIARALIHRPRLLILDEPTAGVDIELRRSMYDFLREINQQGTTIILTTHYLEEAEQLCHNVAIIDHGQIKTQSTMKSMLRQMTNQTFLVETRESISTLPQNDLFLPRQVDEHTLRISLDQSVPVNDLFAYLTQNGIEVTTIRPESNRLEELFLQLVGDSPKPEPEPSSVTTLD